MGRSDGANLRSTVCFAGERLAVHEEICAKTGRKRRRVYDATKHRVQGTELEQYVVRKGGRGGAASTKVSFRFRGSRGWLFPGRFAEKVVPVFVTFLAKIKPENGKDFWFVKFKLRYKTQQESILLI